MQFVAGVVLLVISLLAYWYALPKEDGVVRGYLRNDQVQAYYAIALVCGIAAGILLTILGAVSLFS